MHGRSVLILFASRPGTGGPRLGSSTSIVVSVTWTHLHDMFDSSSSNVEDGGAKDLIAPLSYLVLQKYVLQTMSCTPLYVGIRMYVCQ